MVEILFSDKMLVSKHKIILENVKFCDKPTTCTKFVQPKSCLLQNGVGNKKEYLKNPKLFMFVDNSLMVEILLRIIL